MWADLFQCVLLMVGGITLFFAALGHIPGGWGALIAANPDRMHLYQPPGHEMAPFMGMIVATFGAMIFYQVGNQAMIQRMLAARSTWDALMGLVFAQFINFLRPLVTCFLGLVVYHWVTVMHQAPPLEKADLAFTFALKEFAPAWGVRGIVVAGLISAVMAALSAQVNSASTLFSTDIYKKIIHKGASDREMVRIGRFASFIVLLLAAVISPIVGRYGIFMFFQFTLTAIAIPFVATVLLGVLWKRVNYPAALFGLLGGVAITVFYMVIFSGKFTESGIPALHFFYIGGIAEVTTMIGIAVVSLATAPPDYEKIAPFVWRPQLLRTYDEGVRRPWWQTLKFWFGVVTVIWLYLYWRFW
jgi:SSS family solute:Na+ symporter